MQLPGSTLLLAILSIYLPGGRVQAQPIRPLPLGSFYQEVKSFVQLPVEADPNTLRLFQAKEAIVVVTSNGVFRYQTQPSPSKPPKT
jgi:hypothetical protein